MKRFAKILLLLIAVSPLSAKAQITIDSLSYEISSYGDVILRWSPPQGAIISHYNIYRATNPTNFVLIAEIHSSTATQYFDHHSNVVPGMSYYYWVQAVDALQRTGDIWDRVTITPPIGGLKFTSVPPTTAIVGKTYEYNPVSVDTSSRPEDIAYTFGGPHPDGMALYFIAGGISTYIRWQPPQPGEFRITIIARHKKTGAVGVQEFTIKVASEPGTVRGFVRTVTDLPLANAAVKVFQIQNDMSYETTTDRDGNFLIPNVQAGDLYAYVKSPSKRYSSQWYSLKSSLKEATLRRLQKNDTLMYPFYLITSPNNPTLVSGRVKDASSGNAIDGASVSFIRKNNFLHIGDTSIVSNPSFLENYRVDTTVLTDASGAYAASLNVGQIYYTVVQKPDYQMSFAPDRSANLETNALTALPFRVTDGITDLSFKLWRPSLIATPNRVVGTVTNFDNGINKEAIVVLINSDMKRGAGGGHTYLRSTFTDKNGYFSFDNLAYPSTATYSILALPLDRELLPRYYTSLGGTTVASKSEDVSANGTVQNIDFQLRTADIDGVGAVYGRVQRIDSLGNILPLPGTLLFAEDLTTKNIAGFAISDSAGMYAIVGLPRATTESCATT
ncbi:MAG: carboxypeptidase regulatory-like domain-containing protein [Ignavibacteria bacterium]|nr:carboxypeptidase regulatory-like domain-containing protein [Ignavibacteria bacterium]